MAAPVGGETSVLHNLAEDRKTVIDTVFYFNENHYIDNSMVVKNFLKKSTSAAADSPYRWNTFFTPPLRSQLIELIGWSSFKKFLDTDFTDLHRFPMNRDVASLHFDRIFCHSCGGRNLFSNF
ncbi:MAG: hypothetical protein ISS77_08610 [Phycisphaerae bacterium]|nr:hypothetical protein [Phycisphaerae bacterium]